MLSILIPVYNYDCSRLVQTLYEQCVIEEIDFEIIVLDDTSTKFVENNQIINEWLHCEFTIATQHLGRSKIRNQLASMANYKHLLFIDADAKVAAEDVYFIRNYIQALDQAEVIIGGMKYQKEPPQENRLRWFYGVNREDIPAEKRNQTPYKSLISFNFLIRKEVFLNHSFNENVMQNENMYGHEDTLLGLTLEQNKIRVLHIDNALIHEYTETNEGFLNNSKIAVEKYVRFPLFRKPEVVEKIKIFRIFKKTIKWKLVGLLAIYYKKNQMRMEQKLQKDFPSLRLFDFYRLSYLAYFYKKERTAK